MALAAIASELSQFTNKLGLTPELKLLERAWEHECGAWRGGAVLAAIDGRSIVVEVRSSVIFHDLTLRRRELIRRLNAYFPRPWIRSMAIKMAS